jgi:hypothetical protein
MRAGFEQSREKPNSLMATEYKSNSELFQLRVEPF